MLFAALKFSHLLALMLLFSASLAKNLLIAQTPVQSQSLYLCRRADQVSGAAAGLVVLSGIALLFSSPKGSAFYTSNSLFWLKLFVLFLASALIVRTKLFFRKRENAMSTCAAEVPRFVRAILKFDFASLVVITGLGVLIVSGVGPRL